MHLQTSLARLLYSALLVAGLASLPGHASAAADPNLVKNGGFETGDFSSWTQIGDFAFNGVFNPGGAPEGIFQGYFGPIGSLGGITQSIATTTGAQYSISFVFNGDGGIPGEFKAGFGGVTLLDLTNAQTNTSGDKTFSFNAFATSASTLLSFQFRDDLGFMFLDAVQVSPVPEPAMASLALVGLALLGLDVSRRRKTH